MRKLLLLIMFFLAGWINATAKEEDVCRFYDESEVNCSMRLPEGFTGNDLTWQLSTPHWRVMAQGQVESEAGKRIIDIPLKFDKLKPGVNLECLLALKHGGKIIAEQKLVVYSREIFKSIAAKLKSLNAAAFLPEEAIARLNSLGMELPEKAPAVFGSPENKFIFCEAEKFLDNSGMLAILMERGVTLVMLAPADERKIFLPLDNFSKITLISSAAAKVNGALSVICNKEKIAVTGTEGQGDLVIIEYNNKSKIVIVAAQVCEALDKFPEAALILKENLTAERSVEK